MEVCTEDPGVREVRLCIGEGGVQLCHSPHTLHAAQARPNGLRPFPPFRVMPQTAGGTGACRECYQRNVQAAGYMLDGASGDRAGQVLLIQETTGPDCGKRES